MPRSPKRVQRLAPIEVEVVKLSEGSYVLEVAYKPVYQCVACLQVWPLLHLANDCASRGHTPTFEQTYIGGGHRNQNQETVTHAYVALTFDQYLTEAGQ